MYKTEHIYWMPKTLSINIIDSKLKARVINWHVPTMKRRGVREIWGTGTGKKRHPEMRQKVSWKKGGRNCELFVLRTLHVLQSLSQKLNRNELK